MKKIVYMSTIALALLGTAGVASSAKADEVTDKANLVIKGEFGNGHTRQERLGQDYSRVQAKVNELLGINNVVIPTTAETSTDKKVESMTNQKSFNSATVSAQTQYSHTANGHVQGGYYMIPSSSSSVTNSGTGKTVTGTITRTGIGLEKGVITLAYTLNFDANGNYASGIVTSSGYVDAIINLTAGQNYTGQTISFLSTTGGYAGSGSYIYPITATLNLV